jgi:hypothetical protein
MSKPTVFISYSHKDEEWKERLVAQLGVLQQQGLLTLWEDRRIGAGQNWEREIQEAVTAASVAILLVSANSLTSEFILREEVSRLLQRRDAKGLRIFPVVIKPCAWKAVPWLGQMNLRPKDGRPISGGTDYQIDADFAAIAEEVRKLLNPVASPADSPAPSLVDPEDVSIGRLPGESYDLFGREHELKLLDEAWASRRVNIFSLVAWGGVGKSTLIKHWLGRMAQDHYRGAERVYAWSFYSQNPTDRVVSADLFMDSSLRWFGDQDPTQGSAWNKGERLAKLIRAQRTLLILDGLEPLQYPPGEQEGKLVDQALKALLSGLAALNPGLCLISTRLSVSDLESFKGSTLVEYFLPDLSPEAGAQVLKAQGVIGDEAELEQAAKEFGSHLLTLTLLGCYLNEVHGGDIRCRSEVGALEEGGRYGANARRIMASYEQWFGEGPELAVLRMLGLFDGPGDGHAVDALRADPAIPGLTDTLQPLNKLRWPRVLAKLRRAKLLAEKDPTYPDLLDTHPLVREHFGQQLKQGRPEAWREGNSRLFAYFKGAAKELPDTIEEMAALYAAIAYGCEAGRYHEALREVYVPRVLRGEQYFSVQTLGALGADLAALAGFFDEPWAQPVTKLDEADQAFVRNQAGYRLRALGRWREAEPLLKASLKAYQSQDEWRQAAINAGHLSHLYLMIGDLAKAQEYAERSIELADLSKDDLQRMRKRTRLALVFDLSGRSSEAEELFGQAEQMQRAREPEFPLLYSLPGARYCDLLLERKRAAEVIVRVSQTLEWASARHCLLDIALDHLSLGQAYLLQAQQDGPRYLDTALTSLENAVNGLRQAGQLDYLPRGLFYRAELHRACGDRERAWADVKEAMAIAEYRKMSLHQASGHLLSARLYLTQGEKDKARASWAKAKTLIEHTGYHRRDAELNEIAQQL